MSPPEERTGQVRPSSIAPTVAVRRDTDTQRPDMTEATSGNVGQGEIPSFEPGELLSGCFEVRSLLGQGGMGRVFEALDRELNRRVALKFSIATPEGESALRREAQALAIIQHPSLVTVHALRYHRSIPFMVMERVFGVSLRSMLEERRNARKKLTVLEALEVLIPLGDALSAVHRAGISHRDVKPSNVMIAPGDRVVLMDFGLVLPEYLAEGELGFAGTPGYIAPEVIRGTSQPGQGHLVDLYALGVLAYELLVGAPPFDDVSSLTKMLNHLDLGVPALHAAAPECPRELCELVDGLRAHDPNERTQSAELSTWQLRALRRKLQASKASPLRILILDDDPDVSALLRVKLRREFPEADVGTVGTGQEAIELVRRRSPDVMLVDLGLPDMNGIEFCMYLRGTGIAEHTLMLAISGNVRDEDREVLTLLGVRRFLGKGAKMVEEIATAIREFRPA